METEDVVLGGRNGILGADVEKSDGVLVGVLQMPSGGISTAVQDSTVSDTRAQGGEEVTDSVMKSPEGAIVLGETERSDAKVNGSKSDIANGKGAEEVKETEAMKSLESLTKDADRCRITSSIAAGVAAGVAEGIAESIAETIAKETAGASGHGSMEGREGRFERMAIAKAVAEVIAESVAHEVALGMADGLAEADATVGVVPKKPENPQGLTDGNRDGVLCDCALVAVVRVVGEKSPNRGLRYLMCSRQDPSFFKRKGKRKESDTIGKCKFFRWLDPPRHTSKDDKKKSQPEELNTSLATQPAAKESSLQSPAPSEVTPDLPSRKQRKKSPETVLPSASGGTLTRSALRRGAPEPEPSVDTSAVSTPVSGLKRTIDWTDSYIGPESQKSQGASFRKRRSVRGESGPSSRYALGGSGSGRSAGFGSSEKKPLHYFRRSTGQVGDPGPQNVDSPEPDNRFKSYYKKGKSKSDKGNRVAEEVGTEKKTKPQTRRQQRKLPLSEVYGAMEPALPGKQPSSQGIAGTESPSLEKKTPSVVVSDPKEVGHSTSPPKKRKLSWVLSEDSVVQETETPKRASARKGISSSAERQTSLFETPLVASAFPTVRYEAKLPAEDYHDPDDPWSLEIPWAKHEEEKEKETCEDEAMEAKEERIEAAAAEEELNSRGICEPDNAAGGKESDIQQTTVEDTSTSLVAGLEVGEDLKQSHVDTEHQVSTMPDGAEEELPISSTLISANPDSSVHSRSLVGDPQSTHFEAVHRSEGFAELPLEKGSTPDVVEPKDQAVENAQELMNDSEVPEETGAILQGQQMSTGDETQTSMPAAQTEADEHASAMREATMTETDHERYEQPGANEGEPEHDLQGNVQGTDEPAISGSNLMAVGGADDDRMDHEPERDPSPDQDTALKSPGAAAASENAGNSVWRSASGKKTRSIGSIGAPAVTSKRSRSAGPKGGPKAGRGGSKRQADVQWVDVPLDWRNEKSTGRAPLLPHFSGKALNGSDTTQSEMRLLQSADTHPRGRRGEVDDSSIITEEKEKGHDASFHEGSTDYDAQITNVAHARQATTVDHEASVPAPDDPANQQQQQQQQQQALAPEGNNVAQRRKRGRPRKDSKKSDEFQYFATDGQKSLDAAAGANQIAEPELVGDVGKADGEPSSMVVCSTAMEGNTTTELRGDDRVSQLERSASNTERENGKPEGVSSEPEECGISLNGSDVPSTTLEGLQLEVDAPHCLCKVVPRQAVLKTVVRSGDPNQGLRYWSCSNYRKLFTKKKKPPADVTEESCNYFRWLDTPRVTAKDKREARKERYRQVELQRLL